MGNNYDVKEEKFDMHLKFIGLNIQEFYNNFKNSPTLHEIIKLWKIDSLEDKDLLGQINEYFDFLQKKRNDENNKDLSLKECLVIKMNNAFDPLINCIFEKMNDLSLKQFMPLVLILTSENSNKELTIDTNKYDQIDPRFFFIENYTEDPDKIEETIVPIVLRFCSIHNELGDEFILNKDEKEEEKFDLIERVFPFNLNMACIGRFCQGKSTGVNQILQEYKAKESNNGCSQTKKLTYYQVKNKPIRILDIPGFENDETVNAAIEKLKICHEKVNRLKDNIHIILYFLNYKETRAFSESEYPILEEISKFESTQIIYVITHSKSKNPKTKEKIFDRINSGFQGITRNKPLFDKKEKDKFKATENNVVFVNFHYDEDLEIEPFGKEELFKKIYDFFVSSKDYKESLKKYSSDDQIEKTALKLRAEAERILLPDKIYGAVSGLIPFVDIAIQKFIIKKNALIKVGQIFGIDVKFIDEDIEKEKKLLKKKEKNEGDINYSTPTSTDDGSNPYVIGDTLTEESNEYKDRKSFECGAQAGKYASGAEILNFAFNSASKAGKLSSEVAQLTSKAAQYSYQASQVSAQAAQVAKQTSNYSNFWNFFTGTGTALSKQAATLSSKASELGSTAGYYTSNAASVEIAANQAASAASFGKFAGYGLLGLGVVLGVGCGAYSIHKFCEENLDKFVEYYKKNSNKIKNSLEEAANYFLI